jgi:hypothetical protein
LWTAIIGESGSLKSPACKLAVGHLYRVQQAHREAYRAKMRELTNNEGAKKEDKPRERRVICSDITIERLSEILEDSPRGVLVVRDELKGWVESFTRYKSGQGGSDLPQWLEIFRAGCILYDRKTGDRRSVIVPHAAVSVTGTSQPGVMARLLTKEFFDAGLVARLLLAAPPAPPKRWSEAEVSPDAEAAYHRVIDGLLSLEFGSDADGKQRPHVLNLSPGAKTAWVAFYDDWATQQAAVEAELGAAFAKLEAYAARFTMLHHLVTHVSRGTDDLASVEAESVRAGVALCRWFGHETRRIYAMFSESAADRAIRQLTDYIQGRGGRMSARALQHSNTRKYPTSEAADQALENLVKAGLGRWVAPTDTGKGGWRVRVFELLATVDTSYTRPSAEEPYDEEPSDTRADTCPTTPQKPAENEASVGSVNCRHEDEEGNGPAEPVKASVAQDKQVSPADQRDEMEF